MLSTKRMPVKKQMCHFPTFNALTKFSPIPLTWCYGSLCNVNTENTIYANEKEKK